MFFYWILGGVGFRDILYRVCGYVGLWVEGSGFRVLGLYYETPVSISFFN